VKSAIFLAELAACEKHAERLRWALHTLEALRPLVPAKMVELDEVTIAVLDQFSVRFAKLQDAMGSKLLPGILEITGEYGDLAAFIDKLNRLEKLGAIHSSARWLELREMRNQFSHDYPEDPAIQASLLNKGFLQAELLLDELDRVKEFAQRYLPPVPATQPD
jgi:hypothetical protein